MFDSQSCAKPYFIFGVEQSHEEHKGCLNVVFDHSKGGIEIKNVLRKYKLY